MEGRETMRRTCWMIVAAALSCAPDQGAGPGTGGDGGPDVRDGTGTGCNADDCASRCATLGYPEGRCIPGGACSCSGTGDPGSTDELCGDGLDNNGNGAADEGCGCGPGTTQPCYSGPITTRGRGECRDGVQPCIGSGEFGHWGECTGQILPAPEECDRMDNDCDIVVDEGCPGTCTPTEFAVETICADGLDNECDGLADCHDPDCPPCCSVEVCDGVDNDCDTIVDEDCGGPCVPNEFAGFGRYCLDGIDNDCDGRLDCDDFDCMMFCCARPEVCGDGVDNDCDRAIDCNDSDCCTEPACLGVPVCSSVCCVPSTWRWCDTPTACAWGRQQCRPDGEWGTCEETSERPGTCSSYYYSTQCCVDAGACCQNYHRIEPLPWDASIGHCPGIVAECT